MSPIGVGVGNFIVVGQTALKLYRRIRDSTSEYHQLAIATRQLSDLLTNFRDLATRVKLSGHQFAQLIAHEKDSQDLLDQVSTILDRYQSLHGAAPKLHKKLTWKKATVDDLKSRMATHVSVLHAFYMSISQAAVLDVLEILKLNMQVGNTRAPSVATLSQASVHGDDDVAAEEWTGIITDLENLGITSHMANTHREVILRYLETAVAHGELPYRADSASLYSQPAPAYDNLVDDIFTWLDTNVPPPDSPEAQIDAEISALGLHTFCPRCHWKPDLDFRARFKDRDLVPSGLMPNSINRPSRGFSNRKARSEFEFRS